MRWPGAVAALAVAGAAVLTALVGCTSLGDVHPGEGKKATFRGYSYDEIWSAAYRVAEEHFEIREMDKTRGVIRAERTFHYMQGRGNWIGIYITPPRAGAPAYQVETVAIGKARVEILGQAWESKVLRHMRFALENPSKPIP